MQRQVGYNQVVMFPLPQWLMFLFTAPALPRQQVLAMAEQGETEKGSGGAATAEPEAPEKKPKTQPKGSQKTKPKKPPPKQLPPYKVLLHNDDKNTVEHVILTLLELTPLDVDRCKQVTLEADKTGVALVLVTHKERAELYVDQFKSKSLTVTIEPAE